MEDSGVLNIDNEIHIFCLQYIFLPQINRNINQFIAMWNNHFLRTAGIFSLIQLWMTRSLGKTLLDQLLTSVDILIIKLSISI